MKTLGLILIVLGIVLIAVAQTVTILTGTTIATVGTGTAASWNSHVGCTATVTTLNAIYNGRYNATNGGAFPQGSTYGIIPITPHVYFGNEQANYKRVLPSPYPGGGLANVVNAVNSPCTATDWNSTATGPTFVEIDNLVTDTSSSIQDNANGGDCSTTFPSYNVLNGVTSMGGTFCDTYTNLADPGFTTGCEIGSTSPHVCIHAEIDMDWKAVHFCGSGTTCDNATFDALGPGAHIDIQGFLNWDPDHTNSGGHSWSGWEIHPVTGWRVHSTTIPPGISFSWSPNTPFTTQMINFASTVTNPPSGSYTIQWAFGDNSGASGQTTSHSYATAGTFTVTAQVLSGSQALATATNTITVIAPVASLTVGSIGFQPTNPTAGQTVTFTVSVTGGIGPYTYAWNFGDGTLGGNSDPITHVYAAGGTFGVQVTVSDSSNPPLSGTSTTQIVVTGPGGNGLTVSFGWNPQSPGAGQTVTFTASVSGGVSPYTYQWQIGSTALSGPTASYSWSAAGTYLVTLTVTDSSGASKATSSFVTVTSSSGGGPGGIPGIPGLILNILLQLANYPVTLSGIGLIIAGAVVARRP